MLFLQSEVENEERVSIAATGFSWLSDKDNAKKNQMKSNNAKDVSTAAGLLEAKVKKRLECIFCNSAHSSAGCERAKPLEERREIVKKHVIELMQSIILCFRKRNLGVIADIKKAFLQINLCPRDRDFLRFLWYPEGKLQVFHHKRVVFRV